MELAGRKVAVVGLGISNRALIRFLLKKGARVTGCDRKTAGELGEAWEELSRFPLQLCLGPRYLDCLPGQEIIFVTPGMRKDLPELLEARAKGARVESEITLFFRLCRAPIVGITGSAGKTTTTTLTGEILRVAGLEVRVGGNIGNPLIEEVEDIPAESWVVMELSSFQLQLLHRSPQVGALLNLSPNHLDIHASMKEYVEAKENIFRYQGRGDTVVLNRDNSYTRRMSEMAPSRVIFFSREERVEEGACLLGDAIAWCAEGREVEVCRLGDLKLMGAHNVENVLAAVAITGVCGAPPGAMREVVTTFHGVPHRLELVREVAGVKFYNDSIATTPERTIAALRSFRQPVLLIAGGYDKRLPFEELAREAVGKVKALYTLGATAPKIEAAVEREIKNRGIQLPVNRCRDLAEAVERSARDARPGDVVLLSPACASYDMFRNFEERGRAFREMVARL